MNRLFGYILREGIFGGGPEVPSGYATPDVPVGPTLDEQTLLLEREAELAAERDAAQQEFLLEQEALRLEQEEADRLRIAAERTAMEQEIAQQEQESAGVTDTDIAEAESDVDAQTASMYEALLGGISDEDETEPLPE